MLQSAYDVLVVGAGAAGLYTALCLPSQYRVGLITKDSVARSASDWAQGGIAAVIDPQDSTDLHIADTLSAGAGLCDVDAVTFLVEHAADCIHNLVDLGVAFDRHHNQLALTLEAAHSRRRVLHAADTTGRAVVSVLAERVLERENIQTLDQTFVLDIWLDEQNRCQGVCLIHHSQVHWIRAQAVILATGGGGQVFAQTTNPAVSTGDGVAIAHRAGALLRDLEFVQFHPTALTKPGAPRFLISEAVRGEGAHLVDRTGHRFAFDYHPAGELAPRDVVSRAIFNHIQKTESDPASANVFLDLRPIPVETIQHRFPNIIQVCQKWGVDVFKEPIPVAPAAHYWMGGIGTDVENRTSIENLYAVGETASTGVHGANRLASNSLLECLVFGAQFRSLQLEPISAQTVAEIDSIADVEFTSIEQLRAALPRLVWQSAGISRDQKTLESAIAQIELWQHDFLQLPLSQVLIHLKPQQAVKLQVSASELRDWGELYNLLDVAHLILKSAHLRTESRGGHYRSDFPDTLSEWQVHTIVQGEKWSTAPIRH
ncbi:MULTISPECIES: L-aspartate oxidase [Leptolyngbya]|uniref:L-aspartate oxidase n=1 Tax=Leptolyngbya boryana NIES-2135 TaxID=1973484 RepID=A0A1Z4JM85_LEPBY|nr:MULTISPECIES: L-aspartate oxidase [Leptolyngbya]BAY57859.1 L-aspartate oxidase [Leptolyngbya boryana NIES-2135]MBD2367304.1 L-aspartate oxidase [Leptolyngbya sp. FACHB-161]MBD2373829.1 L-aspartate oxidase [Leptolyngbya sp. FACHB-238]MBD2398372.1 L-aspartate oxidase [Leptolyngbya sp. FACHB-239]MBD2404131.1 L-aspartate oxidase [Leptolyngbya sp. FACHB-402]